MTRGELLKIIEQNGKDYYKDAPQSILRNKHMNNLKGNEQIDKNIVEAVIVDFIKDSLCNLDLVKTKLNYEKG
jgi:hypothetical protein